MTFAILGVGLGRRHGGARGAMAATLAASLLFYGLRDWRLLPLLAASILSNHALGLRLTARPSRALLTIGVGCHPGIQFFDAALASSPTYSPDWRHNLAARCDTLGSVRTSAAA